MGRGEPVVVAAPGVNANHRCWALLAGALGALDGSGTLVAPDLRGRGTSASIIGLFGIDAHTEDLVAVLDRIGASTATVVGHSMGGFVAVSWRRPLPRVDRAGRPRRRRSPARRRGPGGIHDP